ncbi:MAG TPA: hypothetical protein VFB55_02945 [Verrucomicrobiae bacterium]|nr:hypothetical protein [Verrucomicrobiae bacterium]
MKIENKNARHAGADGGLDADAVCEICGRFGAFHLGERTLCPDCYAGCGSCCPEFGKDDLWTFSGED